ncbi:glutathione S-transferase family protein [Halopseudomonas salina]|uniref:Glutathione S-transferase n=1 Tax=Halopseudomonas salina TaxID=1323744 RepID=A0ABQ1P2I8_9GAMM|nr:glutathione S-transferase family protein [Halopseudomonas salina]GGC89781.1 glutathione S-transferase [Halopseudomonas salina]
MALTLYGAILSPFVRKIRIQLAEQAIAHDHVIVAPMRQPDWYFDISPLGRIPAIQDGDLKLADSAVIAQYLEEAYGGPSLYGETAAEAARVRWLEKYADYELAAHATFTVFAERFLEPLKGNRTNEQAVATALSDHLPPLLDYLTRELNGKAFFLGDRMSIADIAVTSQLINMAHVGELIDEDRWPCLSSLLARMTARSSLSSLLPAEHQLIAKLGNR